MTASAAPLSIETHAAIAAPPAQVMQVLTDFAAYSAWNPYIVRIDGAPVAGTTITVHAMMQGRADALVQQVEVVAIEPRAMRWAGGLPDRAQFAGDHWFVVEPRARGTLLRHFEHFSGTLAPAILQEHGATIRANFERFNAALAARAEAGG